MIYKDVYNGNNVITLIAGVRNSNTLRIHSNSIGKTIFETDNIYDTDFLKIYRILTSKKYDFKDFKEIIKDLNKGTRHLNILYIDDFTLFDNNI